MIMKNVGKVPKSVADTRGQVSDAGEIWVYCEIVTGGGTGSYDIDVLVERLTDLQVGSYIFMDEEYRSIPTKTEQDSQNLR